MFTKNEWLLHNNEWLLHNIEWSLHNIAQNHAKDSVASKLLEKLTVNDSTAVFTMEHIHEYVDGVAVSRIITKLLRWSYTA